jgi:hypothetical protein
VTAAADGGLLEVHVRRPIVLDASDAAIWQAASAFFTLGRSSELMRCQSVRRKLSTALGAESLSLRR